jgi:putative Mg2+ transporter-C (MgtC) family protein
LRLAAITGKLRRMDAWIGEIFEPALKLLAAVIIGALVGINRDLYGKPAGLRLCALVSLGSGLITVITNDPRLGVTDPSGASRAIQGIVGGIGFLGAGVILHQGGDSRVRNLTTAATIWMSAALGIACGLGAWRTGGVAAILALIVLTFGARIDRALFGRLSLNKPGVDEHE